MKIPAKVRPLHFYIAGTSGYGKSTLIHAMAHQDIKLGRGVCVIDPKGDLVNQLICSSLAFPSPLSMPASCASFKPLEESQKIV